MVCPPASLEKQSRRRGDPGSKPRAATNPRPPRPLRVLASPHRSLSPPRMTSCILHTYTQGSERDEAGMSNVYNFQFLQQVEERGPARQGQVCAFLCGGVVKGTRSIDRLGMRDLLD